MSTFVPSKNEGESFDTDTDNVSPIGALAASDLAPEIVESIVGVVAQTLRRALHVNLRDSYGNEVFLGQEAGPQDVTIVGTVDASGSEVYLGAPVEIMETPSLFAITYGKVVSTTAVLIAGANHARKSIVISNAGAGNLFVGTDNAVAASGGRMGLYVPPGASYSDSGQGIYRGDLWGIYSASASVENVAVSDRS